MLYFTTQITEKYSAAMCYGAREARLASELPLISCFAYSANKPKLYSANKLKLYSAN